MRPSRRPSSAFLDSLLALALIAAPVHSMAGSTDDEVVFALAFVHEEPTVGATALLDAFGDGDLDLRFLRSAGTYGIRNDGAGSFVEYEARPLENRVGWGAHDFDADGRLDLYTSVVTQPDVLLNEGDGTLSPVDLGCDADGVVRTALFDDFDGDRLIDAFISTGFFGQLHGWNQIHRGLPGGTFGPNIVDDVLDPPNASFWHQPANGPNGCTGEWSVKQFKGAIARDFDGDGRTDVVATAFADRGVQDERCLTYSVLWVEATDRGVFVLHNVSTPGRVSFREVAREAIGADAWGQTSSTWNPYHATPLDYDRDGDLDLFVGAYIREFFGVPEDTPAVRFFENVSTPGAIAFVDRTVETGFASFNDPPPSLRRRINLAAAAPLDVDNDGFVDLAVVNRTNPELTADPYTFLFRNRGDGTFETLPPEVSGLAHGAGGRDISSGDLDGDGRVDLIVNDGDSAGYDGMDESRVYLNSTSTSRHWIQLDIRDAETGSWAIGTRVWIYDAGTAVLLGHDEVRTDFSYRSKRNPVLHFGLGDAQRVDIVAQLAGESTNRWRGVAVDETVTVSYKRRAPGAISNLRVVESAPGELLLSWESDCGGASSVGVYRGDLRSGYGSLSPEPGLCDVSGNEALVSEGDRDAEFFLVVPNDGASEGSYGINSAGQPRNTAHEACFPSGAIDLCAP